MNTDGQERTELMSEEEYERRCARYADYGLFTAPERFMFYYYEDGPSSQIFIAQRPMIGIEVYVVSTGGGGFYGRYETRTVNRFIKMGTWILVESEAQFIQSDIRDLEEKLAQKKAQLSSVTKS